MAMQWHKKLSKHSTSVAGFSLMEAVTTIAVLGVLAALGAPLLVGTNKPLQNATAQMEGVFKQVRMRAISTTTAYRVRQTSPTQIVVEAAATRGCEATTALTAPVAAGATLLPVASTRDFTVGDRINVGSLTNLAITGIDETSSTITLAPLANAQPAGAVIELTNNWRQGSLITGITDEDLTLPRARNSQEQIRIASTPENWSLCFDSRGIANLYNSNGQVISGSLSLSVFRANSGGTQVPGTPTGQITVLQGGSVDSNALTVNE